MTNGSHTNQLSGILLASIVLVHGACAFAHDTYSFELVDDGKVIARDGRKTTFPSVIRLPDWLPPDRRADRSAKYYLYYSQHHGSHIFLKWAESLHGPWHEFNLGVRPPGSKHSARGVFDVRADPARVGYRHVAAPDVKVDHENRQFLLFYHGKNQLPTTTKNGTEVPTHHQNFLATSDDGLNFQDPQTANGQPGHGPLTVTVDGVTRDLCLGPAYQRMFHHHGSWYSVSKRGEIFRPRDPANPWAADSEDPFAMAWIPASRPNELWEHDAKHVNPQFFSPASTFLASAEFANHPNNPNPDVRIISLRTTTSKPERMNHVSIHKSSEERLEVMFWVKEDPGDRFDDIYRLVYDIGDPDPANWDVARDADGQVLFDVVIAPEEIIEATTAVHGKLSGESHADPVSLGTSYVFVDDDGSKYLFFSYVSREFAGAPGEGQIAAVKLIPK